MSYISTATRSTTDTFTEARARYVMGKIFDDFNGLLFREFVHPPAARLKAWRDDVQYVMERDALYSFELQFQYGSQNWVARYEVDKYGGISRDDDSGGLDFYSIPSGATVSIVLDYDTRKNLITDYLALRGWGNNGQFKGESGTIDRSFSKEGFGVNRKLTGGF